MELRPYQKECIEIIEKLEPGAQINKRKTEYEEEKTVCIKAAEETKKSRRSFRNIILNPRMKRGLFYSVISKISESRISGSDVDF